MNRGLFYSGLLHLSLFILMIVGLPTWLNKTETAERVITVDILPISSVTNIKPEEKKAEKKEEKKEEPKEKEKLKPKPRQEEVEEKKKEAIPDKKKPEKKKEQVKKKEEKKKPDKKKKQEDFDSVLKSVEKIKEDEDFLKDLEKDLSNKEEKNKKKGGDYNPNMPLSISERDAIIQQISECWNIPAGAKDAGSMLVKIRVSFAEDGSATEVKIMDMARYSSGDAFFVAAADSAVRAVKMCSPLKGLPKDKYSTWKEIELNFDPKEMIY